MDSAKTKPTNPDSKRIIKLLYMLLSLCKNSLNNHSCTLPLYHFQEQLNPETLQYQLKIHEPFTLNTLTLPRFVRILEIIKICIDNLQNDKIITKRNLFYKLAHYYQMYRNIDKDLKLVCQNVSFLILKTHPQQNIIKSKINRSDLGVIASSRCVLQGKLQIVADGRVISDLNSQVQIRTLPTCQYFQARCHAQQIIIIEKESMFYQIATIFKQRKVHQKYLLISAKGYPDQITRRLLLQFMNQKQSKIDGIYYLGDYDVFGFDIFLFYALGDWFCEGLLPKIQLIRIANYLDKKIFDENKLKMQMNKFNKADFKKAEEIKNSWFGKINTRKSEMNAQLCSKINEIYEYFNFFVSQSSKCQLELLSLHANSKMWVQEIIQYERMDKKRIS